MACLRASAATTPIADWRFGEFKFSDMSGNGYALTRGTSSAISAEGYLSFDGTANSPVCTTTALALSGAPSLTIELWVNFKGTIPSSCFMIFETGDDYAHNVGGIAVQWSGTAITAYLQSKNTVYTDTGNAHCSSSDNPFTSTKSDWHHVAVVMVPGEKMKLYIDGVDDTHQDRSFTMDIPSTATFASLVAYIGARNRNNYLHNAYLGGVQISSGAKTAAEILADYGDGTPPLGAWADLGLEAEYLSDALRAADAAMTNPYESSLGTWTYKQQDDTVLVWGSNSPKNDATITSGFKPSSTTMPFVTALKAGVASITWYSTIWADEICTHPNNSDAQNVKFTFRPSANGRYRAVVPVRCIETGCNVKVYLRDGAGNNLVTPVSISSVAAAVTMDTDWLDLTTTDELVFIVDRNGSNACDGTIFGGYILHELPGELVVDDIPAQLHTGSPITPAVTVRAYAGGPVLTEGTDYTLAYESNVAPGAGYAVVTGLADYEGRDVRAPFTIYQPYVVGPSDYAPGKYLQSGLVAHWDGEMNKTSSAWSDLVAGYTFELTGVTVSETQCLGFSDNSTSYGKLTSGADDAFPTGAKTVEVVVRPSNTADGIVVHGPSGCGVTFGSYSSGILIGNIAGTFAYQGRPSTTDVSSYATIYGGDNYPRSGAGTLPNGIYLNGARATRWDANNYFGSPDAGIAWIGKRSNDQYCYSGRLYAVRIYGRELTEDEIAYNAAVDDARFRGDTTALAAYHVDYYLCDGDGMEKEGASSFSGTAGSLGWSFVPGGGRDAAGFTGGGTYFVTPTSGGIRTPSGASGFATPSVSPLTVQTNAVFHILIALDHGGALTLNNLTLQKNARLALEPGVADATHYADGTWTCEPGSAVCLLATGTDACLLNLRPTLTGTGTLRAYVADEKVTSGRARTYRLSGDLTGWTGDVEVGGSEWSAAKLTLEILGDNALPADDPDTPACVAVSNSATLKVSADWDSGANRTWDFGDDGIPTINVAGGKTVTVRGPVAGTVGFRKTGDGLLIFASTNGAERIYSGVTSVSAQDLADYRAEASSPRKFAVADIPVQKYYGTPCEPEPDVTRAGTGDPLTNGVHYTVAYANNDKEGYGTAVVTGLGAEFEGCTVRKMFRILDALKPGVPEGFTQLTYIKPNGAQYINTGYTPSDTDVIEMKVQFSTVSEDQNLFCARDGSYNNTFSCWLSSQKFRFDRGNDVDKKTWGTTLSAYQDYVVKLDAGAGKGFANGLDVVTLSSTAFTAPCNWYLFVGSLNGTSSFVGYAKFVCYYVKVWNKDGELILNFLPARKDDTGEVGLYETVNGAFFGNASGSGTITAGPAVYELPEYESYTTGDYVQDGLVAQWDGETKTAGKWTDLVGGRSFTLTGVDTTDAKSLAFAGNSSSYGTLASDAAVAFPSGEKTVEIVVRANNSSDGIYLHGPSTSGITFGSYQGNVLIGNKNATFGYSGRPSTTYMSTYATIYGADDYPRPRSGDLWYGLFTHGVRGSYANVNNSFGSPNSAAWLGKRENNGYCANYRLYALRVYNRQLTEPEIAANAVVDAARFDSPTYYLCNGTPADRYTMLDPGSTSSFSGTTSGNNYPVGWTSTRGGTREFYGMLGGRNYVITPTSGANLRAPPDWQFFESPINSTLTVETGARLYVLLNNANAGVMTLNNLTLQRNATFCLQPGGNQRYYSVQGDWTCEPGSVVELLYRDSSAGNDTRYINLGAKMTGTGTILAYMRDSAVNNSNTRVQKLTGDLRDWSGSFEAYGGSKGSFTLEVTSATAIPKDDPLDPARVTVTNRAILSVLCDWVAGPSRSWDFGPPVQAQCGKVSVAAGKTLTIQGPILSTNGFWKTGTGTLVLGHPRATPRAFTGTCFIPPREIEEYCAEIAADTDFRIASIDNDQFYEGTPCQPTPSVLLRADGTPLEEGVDYEVAYTNNAQEGMAHVIVTGLGTYAGQVLTQKFRVRDLTAAKLPYGVTLLEYVEFTGGQHVDTGVVPKDHQVEVRYYTTTYVRDGHIFGTDYSNAAYRYMHWTEYDPSNSRSDWSYYWGYVGSTEGNANSCVGLLWKQDVHDVVYNGVRNHEIMIDGQLLTSGQQSYSESTLYIGRRSSNSNFKGRIYSFKITDRATGKAVRDMLPCQTASGAIGFVDRVTGSYYLPSGTLTAGPAVFSPTLEAPDLPVTGALLHVDANDLRTLVLEEKQGRRYIKRCNDASGGTRYAYSGWHSSIAAPYVGTRDGLNFIDFGPSSQAGHGGALAFNTELTTIREVYMVFSDYPGCPWASFLLGNGYSNNAKDYHFHRGGTRGALFHGSYAHANILNGTVQVDGQTVRYDVVITPGFHVIRVKTTGNVNAARFCVDRDTNGNGRGGQLIGEAIIYDRTLTDEEAERVTAYLQKKWKKLFFRAQRKGKGVPGMRWKMFGAWNDTSDWTPTASDPIVPGALLASCTGGTYNDGTYSQTMGEYHNFSYKGAVWMEAGKRWNFSGYYDDGSYVYLTPPTGVRLNVNGSNNETGYTPTETGWHTIDVRVGNHNGGVGPAKAPFNSASQLGAGIAWNTNGVATCQTSNYTSWRKFMNTADDIIFYTDEPSVTLYGTNCFWTGAGGDSCWSNVYNWTENRAPSTNGCDTVYVDGDATIDFSGAALYELVHRAGELTVTGTDGDPLVLSADFTSTGAKVTWGGDTYLTSGTHVFSNACPFVCADGFRLRGIGSLTKKGFGAWTVAAGATNGVWELEGTLRIEEGDLHTFPNAEQVWMPRIEIDGPTAQLVQHGTIPYTLNRNDYFYLGTSKTGGRFRFAATNDVSVYRMYIQNVQCGSGTWRPYPWGMETTGEKCWPDIWGTNVTFKAWGNDNVTLFTPLGMMRDTGRVRTWTGAAYDDDPDNPANWKEGIPAWYCDNLVIEADGAPSSIRSMEFHDLRLYYDWATTNLVLWGTLHLSDGFLQPACADVVYTLAGDWNHMIDGRRFVLLRDGATLSCVRELTLGGAGGLRFPEGGDCVPQPIFGDLTVTGGGRVEAEAGCGLAGVAFPGVTNVVISGFGSCVESSHRALFNDDVVLSVSGGARHKLGPGINQNVLWFVTNGRKRPGRVYTGSGPNGVKLPDYLSGEGTVTPRRGGMGLIILGHGRQGR